MKKTKACHCCDGSGKEVDHVVVGLAMRKIRLSKGLSQLAVAKSMGIGISYVSDLERGRRNWTEDKVAAFERACA